MSSLILIFPIPYLYSQILCLAGILKLGLYFVISLTLVSLKEDNIYLLLLKITFYEDQRLQSLKLAGPQKDQQGLIFEF